MISLDEIEELRNDFMKNVNAGEILSELMGVEVIFDQTEYIDFGLIDRGYVRSGWLWNYANRDWQEMPALVLDVKVMILDLL